MKIIFSSITKVINLYCNFKLHKSSLWKL